MRRVVSVTVLAFCVSTSTAAAPEQAPRPRPAGAAAKTPSDKFKALVKAQEQGQKDFSDAYQAAKTDEERKKVSDELGRRSMLSSSDSGGFAVSDAWRVVGRGYHTSPLRSPPCVPASVP